ncbi:MerC domain-containing protein [Sphingopyxis macrogoltabida]|uniref:MerC domain-containing protein n=1 Tax=Sphingopyxis macrogoltabida TaxID=33050 RepID=UPI0006ED3985|nr:MerC domain-containing protein [Sphingopyxis macrogoltabida]ALJ15062.1 membrane protein [Sphingopyxis macrogoltabida]
MTHVASHAPALTRLGAIVRAARDSRPLTSLNGDQLAMGLSGLCLVHCLATTIFFASIASVGGVFLENHLFHEIGLIIAIGFALVTLVSGVLSHGYMMPFAVGSFGLGMMAGALSRPHDGSEVLATMVGVAVVALGHDLNRRASH